MDQNKQTFAQIIKNHPIDWKALWNWYSDKVEEVAWKVIDFVKNIRCKVVSVIKKK